METYKKIFEYFRKRQCFPEGFNQWSLANKNGWTIAHLAVQDKRTSKALPEDFDQWNLRDRRGWTVAHEAACYETLPKDFNKWDLTDKKGWTVAHEAVAHGQLPKNFHQWELKNIHGETVFEVLLFLRPHRSLRSFTDWDMVLNDNGETCRDVYQRFKGGKQ